MSRRAVAGFTGWAVLMAFAMSAHAARSGGLKQLLAEGELVLPPEWAGVWSFADTSYTCSTPNQFIVDTGLDTLCAGVSFEPVAGVEYSCFGTVSATVIDVTCMATITVDECTVTLERRTQATRNGETMREIFTTRESYSPSGCSLFPDSCFETRRSATRVAPKPTSCTSPVEGGTWTGVKQLYR